MFLSSKLQLDFVASSGVNFLYSVLLEFTAVVFALESVLLLQARALISKLTDEKNNAVQQNNKLRQDLVSDYI